jgi:hypothetical protein
LDPGKGWWLSVFRARVWMGVYGVVCSHVWDYLVRFGFGVLEEADTGLFMPKVWFSRKGSILNRVSRSTPINDFPIILNLYSKT